MGQWGIETYSGDSVMDYIQRHLPTGDFDEMTQKRATRTIEDVWIEADNGFDRLGVVVWLITHGFKVAKSRLEDALQYANDELHPDILRDWGNRAGREEMLTLEMIDIRYAIKHGGKSKRRDEPTLHEEMATAVETAPKTVELPCYNIVANLTGDGGGSITSDLKETCHYCYDFACMMDCEEFGEHCSDRDMDEQVRKQVERYEFLCHRAAVDALESIILGHGVAGVDIESLAYIEGIETAVQALMNADYAVE